MVNFRFAWSFFRIFLNIFPSVLKQVLHSLRLKICLWHWLRQIFVAVLADQVSIGQPSQYGVKRLCLAKNVNSISFSLVVYVLGWLSFLSVPGKLACDATAVACGSFVWEGIGFVSRYKTHVLALLLISCFLQKLSIRKFQIALGHYFSQICWWLAQVQLWRP